MGLDAAQQIEVVVGRVLVAFLRAHVGFDPKGLAVFWEVARNIPGQNQAQRYVFYSVAFATLQYLPASAHCLASSPSFAPAGRVKLARMVRFFLPQSSPAPSRQGRAKQVLRQRLIYWPHLPVAKVGYLAGRNFEATAYTSPKLGKVVSADHDAMSLLAAP